MAESQGNFQMICDCPNETMTSDSFSGKITFVMRISGDKETYFKGNTPILDLLQLFQGNCTCSEPTATATIIQTLLDN